MDPDQAVEIRHAQFVQRAIPASAPQVNRGGHRWARMARTFTFGGTVAQNLCRRFGMNRICNSVWGRLRASAPTPPADEEPKH
jgi:hypothetical protein